MKTSDEGRSSTARTSLGGLPHVTPPRRHQRPWSVQLGTNTRHRHDGGRDDRIDPTEAAQLVALGSHVLVDVREDTEWDAGHAPQARHVPLGHLAAVDLSTATPVIAVCRSGDRSTRAVEAITARSVEAHNLTGGMIAWAEAGLEVRDGRGEPGDVV